MIDGIDVAYPQYVINWKALADAGNISFVSAKVTQGLSGIDKQFHNNWQGIMDNGFIRGAYHFADTSNDPIKEAQHFLDVMGQIGYGDFLALDIEVSNLTGPAFTNWVLSWLEKVEQVTGTTPFIYTGGPFFNQHAGKVDAATTAKLRKYPLWLAAYVTNPDKYVPDIWKDLGWILWQKAGDIAAVGDKPLHVAGIKTVVDHDVFKGTANDLKQLILNLHPPVTSNISNAFNV